MVRGCRWFCCWRFVPPSPNKVYRPWRDAISKAAVSLSGGLLEDATANSRRCNCEPLFHGHAIQRQAHCAQTFELKWFSQKSFVNTSSPMSWQICLVHSSEPWIGDPTGVKVETMTFAVSSRSTFALKRLPRDRFWFWPNSLLLLLLICLLASMIFVVCQQTWKATGWSWQQQCKTFTGLHMPQLRNTYRDLLTVFPSHIHSVPTAVANCCWWQGFAGASDESAQMHSWCFGPVSTITSCVGTAAVILEKRKRCQPNHSVHTLSIFSYSHSIKRTETTWSQSVRLTRFKSVIYSTSHSRVCAEHIVFT